MKLHGVVNMSPDSLATFSIAHDADEAYRRACQLIEQGCVGIDIGGAGSTQFADRVDTDIEWNRLEGAIARIVELDVELSVDSWNPEVMRRSLASGATIMNAADGLQDESMIDLAAESGAKVVLPFLSGPDPKAMVFVQGDPYDTILPWFENRIAALAKRGIGRDQLIIDPGTGFGPPNWEWEHRAAYQRAVYGGLARLRVFGRPVYMALPWKFDGGRLELLDILLTVGFDYGRTHLPAVIRQRAKRLAHSE